MKLPRYELLVKQAHQGANGVWFDAWSYADTLDPVKAVLLANEKTYQGRKLSAVSEMKLIDNGEW